MIARLYLGPFDGQIVQANPNTETILMPMPQDTRVVALYERIPGQVSFDPTFTYKGQYGGQA